MCRTSQFALHFAIHICPIYAFTKFNAVIRAWGGQSIFFSRVLWQSINVLISVLELSINIVLTQPRALKIERVRRRDRLYKTASTPNKRMEYHRRLIIDGNATFFRKL
jgi:hypothetical protein